MESLPTPGTGINGGSIAKWPPWGRGRRAASCNSVDQENEGTYIPLSDLRSTESISESLMKSIVLFFSCVPVFCILLGYDSGMKDQQRVFSLFNSRKSAAEHLHHPPSKLF